MTHKIIIGISTLALLAPGAIAQSNISANQKYAWCENLGWTNWADANGRAQGVAVRGSYLAGHIWSENGGWIDVGSIPANGIAYANIDNTDFGVNIDPATGELFGYAWAENLGWINFDTRVELGPFNQQARFDWVAGRFFGYAWLENGGWMNLDDPNHYVAYCPADVTTQGAGIGDPNYGVPDGQVTAADLNYYVNAWIAGTLSIADLTTQGAAMGTAGFGTPDGQVTAADLNFFVNEWVAGCP